MTDERVLFKVYHISGILTTLNQNCCKIIFWLFIQNLSRVVNFCKPLVYILRKFRVEIVRWCSSFQSIFLCEYFKMVKYPGCLITIRSILKMMIASVFSNVWRQRSNHGIRSQLTLRRLWYIFYTILLNIFLLVGPISYWTLSLEYWKFGDVSSMKITLQCIWNTMVILVLVESVKNVIEL